VFGSCDVLAEKPSAKQWQQIRDVHPLCDGENRVVWKLSVTPSEGAAVISKLSSQLDVRYYFDWAGGLIWLSVPETSDASASIIRASFEQGHATLIRASAEVRSHVEVFQTQPPALAALTARVKQTFDPQAVLNPGRMYKDT
jgi:glycolate oxidase FAD binding subunit